MSRHGTLLATIVVVLVGIAIGQEQPVSSPITVSASDLLTSPAGANWASYNGDYTGRRYSSLREINTGNVQQLRAAWVFHPGNSQNLETTPVVVRGVMYVTAANDVIALDARTGRQLWRYSRPLSSGLLDDAASHKNRGVGVWQNSVFIQTDDAHLLALDARSGGLLWDVQYADKKKHYGSTGAPLVVKDEVIVGTSGGDSGVRGFVAAFDAVTGKKKWQRWTIPAPGEFGSSGWLGDAYLHGGGSTWMTGTYDPELNTLYWTTSNAAPDFVDDSRPGDDLYTACVLALDADTGEIKWYFQFTPHDLFDFDANETPVLADVMENGVKKRLLFQANRNGFFYVLDRTEREIPPRDTICEKNELGQRRGCDRASNSHGASSHAERYLYLSRNRRRHKLVCPLLQSRYRGFLCCSPGKLQHLLRKAPEVCSRRDVLQHGNKRCSYRES